MTILLVRPRAGGGLAAHVDQERALLTAAGIEVRDAEVRIQDRPHPLADRRTVRTLRREITASSAAAVHAHGLRAGALTALALPRRPAAGRRGRSAVRFVVTVHNRTVGGVLVRGLGTLLLRILARRADTVLAVSPDLAEDARRAGAADVRHAIVPAPAAPPDPGDAIAAGPAVPEPDRDGQNVLVIARLAAQKGLDDLLDAAAVLRDRGRDHGGPAVRIRVAGDGPLREHLHTRIRDEHLPVELLGRRDDIPALLEEAELVVSAARWEGQPVALQEALRAGCAIVATDAGGTRWVTGDAARLVPVGDPHALAAAIGDHRAAPVRRRAEAASRRRAADLPTAGDLTDQLLDVLAPGRPRW